MKKHLFKSMLLAAISIMFALNFTSCKDDDDEEQKPAPAEIVLDGYYVKGAGTFLTSFDDKGMMTVTRNEVTQEDRSALMELYIAVKAGTDGFNIVGVDGDTKTTYGPGADFAKITETGTDEPTKAPFWRGGLEETDTPFTVEEDGLYHVVIDTEVMKVVVAKVEWGVIGAATPGGWSDCTELTEGAFDLESITFEGTNIQMMKGDYKFRYSGGWKIEIDTTYDNGTADKGLKVNTNFGGSSLSDLVPGGSNINNGVVGIYTVKATWSLADGYTFEVTKTGDIEPVDYSDQQLGLIGDGIIVADTAWGWGSSYDLKLPVISNTTDYTWTWENIQVSTDGSFKIRDEKNDWSGMAIGYPQVTMAGGAAGDFETNGDGNFVPKAAGNYNFTLLIDAAVEEYTLTVEAAK